MPKVQSPSKLQLQMKNIPFSELKKELKHNDSFAKILFAGMSFVMGLYLLTALLMVVFS
jgi:PHP family Zn ribbon phosphoesterase